MKAYIFLNVLILQLIFHINASSQPRVIFDYPSGTYNSYTDRITNNFGFSDARNQIETAIDEYLTDKEAQGAQGQRAAIVTIPVVFHVIEHEASNAGYVSYSTIQNQIDALNSHFRKRNTSEINTLPASMKSLAADTRIEFVLAQRADGCSDDFEDNEPGVTRTRTSQSPFIVDLTANSAFDRYPMKFTNAFGRDGFPAENYLNIWVCELAGDACGYASLPGDPTNEDGIVIDYRCLVGAPSAPYHIFDEGKALTQMVAQWLNLYNIWGIEDSSCTDSDQVDDTPNQDGPNYGVTCPNSPSSCGNAGDFYQNFMAGTSDFCKKFFTKGQADRMEATLLTYRRSLLGSQGGVPISGSPTPDLWMKDTPEDIGNEPNTESPRFWKSQDIWVRNNQPTAGSVNPIHQNPMPGGDPNYVYVRVQNRGCAGIQQGTLTVYWAKASSGLSFPAPWDGSVTSPAVLGGVIGSTTVSVIAGESIVYEIPWANVPNPQDYASFGADRAHFCLLAVIETPNDSKPVLPPTNQPGVLQWFVQKNNNVVWKNISISEPEGSGDSGKMLVSNFENDNVFCRLVFQVVENEKSPFLNGTVVVDLVNIHDLWKNGGSKGKHIEHIEGSKFRLLSSGAYFENINLPASSHHAISIRFDPDKVKVNSPELYQLDVSHFISEVDSPIGGQTFFYKVDPEDIAPGKEWTIVKTKIKEDLYTAHFPSEKIGFAGGTKGCVIRTKDGGKTWKPKRLGIPRGTSIYSIYFLNEKEGFAVGSNGGAFRTKNGGCIWKKIKATSSNLRDITFLDNMNGFIVADGALFKTEDGGNNWTNVNTSLPTGISPSDLISAEIHFIDNMTGFILLNGNILKTLDKGITWEIITIPGNALHDIDFVDSNNGFICGIGTGLLNSTDGGESWQKVNTSPSNTPQAVKFINNRLGYTAGRNGEIYQTIDGGNSWSQNSTNTTKDLHELLYLKESKVALVFGKGGIIEMKI
jgi:photosystem II stability/assembly factor-like uncharacterized protein